MKTKHLQPDQWFTCEEPGSAFPNLPDDVLEVILHQLLISHDMISDPYSCFLAPLTPTRVCRRWRDVTLSRGTFWSMLLFSRSTVGVHRELLETIIARSRLVPLRIYICSNQGDLDHQNLIQEKLRSLWSRVRHLYAEYAPSTVVFKFLETDDCGMPLSPGRSNLIWLRLHGCRPSDARWFVGPSVTRLSLHWMTMSATRFAWILRHCKGLKDLILFQFRLNDVGPDFDDVGGRLSTTGPPKGTSRLRSLRHLDLTRIDQLDKIVPIIVDRFPLTAANASIIEVARQGWRTPTDLAHMFNLVDVTQYGPLNGAVLTARDSVYYRLTSADGCRQREFEAVCSGWQNPQPLRTAILGMLKRVVHIEVEFRFTHDMLEWLKLWRGETLPHLRKATIGFRVHGDQNDRENQLLPLAPDAPRINTPELDAVHFQGHVGSDRSAAQYYINSPLVRSWARFCMAVVGSFESTHEIALSVSSTREFVVSSQVLQDVVVSCR